MRLERTAIALAVAAALAAPPAVMAQQPSDKPTAKTQKQADQNKGGLASTDDKFVMGAAHGGMAEVELGKMAAEKGSSDKTLPTLEDHLKQAQDMQAQVKTAPRAAR